MTQGIAISEVNNRRETASKLINFAVTLGASVGTFAFFALQGILLARMLGPEQRGVFASAVMFPQALLYLGLLGAPELFAGYAAEGKANAPLRRSAACYGLVAGLVSAVACILLNLWLIPGAMREALPLAILCALTMPLQQIRLAVQAVDHGQRELPRYNRVRLLASATFPALLLVAFCIGTHDLQTACVLFVVAQILSLGLVQFGMDGSWIGELAVSIPQALSEARGLMGAWFSTELLERLDLVLMMVLVAQQETLGHYAAAVPIAALMIIVPNAVGLYAFNRGARQDERLTTRDAWQVLALGVVVQLLCAACLAAAMPWLIGLFYGPSFEPTVMFAWLLIPAGIFRGLLQACDSYLRARKKPGIGVRARALSIPILLIVSFTASAWVGPAAIPLGLSIAQMVCFLIVGYAVIADTRDVSSTPALA